jgi:valyl-tRNA synthetase
MNLEGGRVRRVEDVAADLELTDRWILSRLDAAVEDVTRQLESLRFHEAAEAAYHFFWGEVADWYIELIKGRLRGDAGEASADAARAVLVATLDGALRLLHPVMPFITESLWLRLPVAEGAKREASLVVAQWPVAGSRRDGDAEARMTALMELIGAVRTLRSEYNVPVAAPVALRLGNVAPDLAAALEEEGRALERLARVGDVARDGAVGARGTGAHAVLKGGTELFMPLEGLIDLDRERQRLRQEMERVDGLLGGVLSRLGNESFVKRAPAEVVAREREKAENFRDQRDRLARKLDALA